MANGLFNLKQVMQAVQQGGWSNQKPPAVEYLVVAGGGGGGQNSGGAGAGGGLLAGVSSVPNGSQVLVTVGTGGAGGNGGSGNGTIGNNSAFGLVTATGGGYGGYNALAGGAGGSGGGGGAGSTSFATQTIAPGQGTANQGNAGGFGLGGGSGGQAGGGGGAGSVGLNAPVANIAGNGGAGIASAISGTVTAYAGGGGGGTYPNTSVPGTGGSGGGGNGASVASAAGSNGTNFLGGGGGGGAGGSGIGGNGGTGIVIVSYPDVYAAATTVNATASTSGSGSVGFNGTTQAVVYTDNAGLALGTGDFTVECFVYPGSQASGNSTVIGGEASGAFQITLTSGTGTPTGVAINAFGTGPFFSQSYAFSQNVWYHIACTRNGTSVRVYVNGVQLGSTTSDSTNFSAGTRAIGAIAGATAQRYAGYVSNVRIVKGTALYTGSTLTVPTAPLTAVSGTSLLLSTVSGAYLADGSTNSLAVSAAYSSPAWNQLSPFTGTGYKNRVYTWTSSGTITF